MTSTHETSTPGTSTPGTGTSAELDPANPFATPWDLPYGLPDFAAIREEHYEPAVLAGMAAHRAEVEAIATDPEPPTVENTLDALERSGRLLDRVATAFYSTLSADSTPGLEDIQERLAPLLAAHQDAVDLDARLYARVTALADAAAAGTLALEPDTAYLLERRITRFERAGIALSEADQATLRELNARITTLQASFGRKLLAGANEASVLVTDEAELAGLSPDARAGARAAALARGQEGWLLEMQLFTHQNVLASLESPALRERVQQASASRGATGGDTDTREVLLEIVRLRARRARLLGYEHHAAYVAADATAGSADAVGEMLARLAPAAVANARREAEALAAASGAPDGGVRAADWSYLNEKVRKERFDLDDAALRPYLELDRVVHDGVFRAAGLLFGLSFTERHDLAGYHPDVRVFEVFDAPEPGEPDTGLGLFLGDWYTRESKRGGAWMNSLVTQSRLFGERPVVVNNLNIVKPPAGEPTLLVWDEVTTLFHEFGHALHGLLSDVRYPSQSGTAVPRDFVEYPSQVNEMWAWEPQVLRSFAVHHVTGEPMPAEWVDTMLASRVWGEGFATTEYLAAALLDQAWHRLTPEEVPASAQDVLPFEAAALAAAGVDLDAVPPRYRTTYFNHIFGGGYAAGYYSYIWSEVLDADTVEWYQVNGGLTRENGETFRRRLLARGGSQDPLASFEDLRGRAADITPLLKRRGLA
ncbi:M3 family metallopeptidase [Promicromonospora thailandica]|uniref:Peptidyl-dipeptidase Dcp n=1 Tax=Promicromonospora thailandica TaxID=765201 RepID=A0A9X2JX18_9MICO|nr:M3 family metallopeptidase [Promicromonospora thailandica]MCP2266731.1 peptidyl-dipeptidase Dcp [Promicromonospora thailandica]BFF21889.1 M3 family metallopeptidase [Promicromonospora thailandica]